MVSLAPRFIVFPANSFSDDEKRLTIGLPTGCSSSSEKEELSDESLFQLLPFTWLSFSNGMVGL